jgi:hypothetical protein
MSPLIVLLAVSAVGLAMGLLLLTAWLEQSVLSPRYLITRTVKVRNTPEHAERMVAVQAAHLLDELER